MSARNLGILIYFFLSLFLVGKATQNAFETVDMPFAGILPYENLYVGAFTQAHWEGAKQGLGFHDRVVSLDGKEIADGVSWNMELGKHAESDRTQRDVGVRR